MQPRVCTAVVVVVFAQSHNVFIWKAGRCTGSPAPRRGRQSGERLQSRQTTAFAVYCSRFFDTLARLSYTVHLAILFLNPYYKISLESSKLIGCPRLSATARGSVASKRAASFLMPSTCTRRIVSVAFFATGLTDNDDEPV